MATVSRREVVVNKGGRPRTLKPCAVGRKIDAILLSKRMTRSELAAEVGISKVAMHHIIHGTNQPRLQTAKKICTALGVGLAEIF